MNTIHISSGCDENGYYQGRINGRFISKKDEKAVDSIIESLRITEFFGNHKCDWRNCNITIGKLVLPCVVRYWVNDFSTYSVYHVEFQKKG